MESHVYHIPVMLMPSVDGLNINESGVYVDVTLGGGGHSREILRRLGPNGHLYSFDQDAEAISFSLQNSSSEQWTLVRSNFRYLKNWMRYYGVEQVDGVLADLGVSSHHFDEAERGFSFRTDSPLDMRMNQQADQTAADVVNNYPAEQLTSLFRIYGELRQAPRLAAAIVKARQRQEIRTTGQLAELMIPLISPAAQKKDLAKAFQALRMEVNHEMDALREMLRAATDLLKPGGRLVVMSYHSLEDRIVKNLMRAGNIEGEVQQDVFGRIEALLHPIGKPLVPSEEELAQNPRSRSAKLRIAEKVIEK
ncbi:MAG: 16S rRNA (cytosine(1402)-N(4))-methyltransferase RsmH [Bacteroidaceae bacterium]|nr:16S rRNA (cytosine(1402)-N(4))-methyltransferase RsmH [Bacteroidaceae bacterium]